MFVIITESRAKTSEGVGCAENHGKSQFMGSPLHLFYRSASFTLYRLYSNLVEAFYKQITVLRINDSLHGGAQHFHTVLLKHTTLVKFHAAV